MDVLQLKSACVNNIRTEYMYAEQYQLTCDQLTERLAHIVWNDPRFKKLPRYARNYIEGYHQAVRDRFWATVLEWRVLLDGQLVASKEVPNGHWSDTKPGCYVYKSDPTKPFTAIQD